MKKRNLFAALMLAALLSACGNDKDMDLLEKNDYDRSREETETIAEPEEPDVSDTPTPAAAEESGESLAKRLCGKYSYHLGGDDGTEYLIMNIVSFGDNLYAFCGNAFAEEGVSTLSAYSFWATEFVPKDASGLKDTDADSVDVTAFRFSSMSNAGRYWDSGRWGSISLDPMGVVFRFFDDDNFLTPDAEESRLFLKDERVEDVFPYLDHDMNGGDPDLQGMWVNEDTYTPLYLYFVGSDLYVYRKEAGVEVRFDAGGYEAANGSFSCMASTLGNGDMPCDWYADYEVDDDTLTLDISGDPFPGNISGKTVFKRTDAGSIHSVTLDEFGPITEMKSADLVDSAFEDGFYGIWIAAEKNRDDAIKRAEELNEKGFDSYVAFSPEWEDLNSRDYYCVTADRCYDETDAEAALITLQDMGYDDAYIKHSGKHRYTTIQYTNFGGLETDFASDRVVLINAPIDYVRCWTASAADDNIYADLVIDEDTVFDESCDMEFFGNYKTGDTPLEWYLRNLDLMDNLPEEYASEGVPLSGVFEVGVTGDHIDRFFGCYWWD